jgi:hypothetical protein
MNTIGRYVELIRGETIAIIKENIRAQIGNNDIIVMI